MQENIENLGNWVVLYRYYGLLTNIEIHYKVSKLGNCYTITLADRISNNRLFVTGQLFDNQVEIDGYLEELKQKLILLAESDANVEDFI